MLTIIPETANRRKGGGRRVTATKVEGEIKTIFPSTA